MRTLLLLFIFILLLWVLVKRLDSPDYTDEWYEQQGGYSMAEGGGEESRAESWAADPTHWSNPGYKAARKAKAEPKPTSSKSTKSISGSMQRNPHVDRQTVSSRPDSPITPTARNSSITDAIRAALPVTVGAYAADLHDVATQDMSGGYPAYQGLTAVDRYQTGVDATRHGAAAMRYGLPAMTAFEKLDDDDTMDYTNNELATGWKSSTPNAKQSSRDRGWANAVAAEMKSQLEGWLPGIKTGMPISFDRRSKGEPASPLSEMYSQMGYGRPMIDGSWNPGIGFQRYTKENEPTIGTGKRPARSRRTNYGPAMEGGTTGPTGQGLWT